jgi:chromosome segregation protein
VHLKSLTLRGFKSFASATTLRFEPGITCVVGPNGSGKSNVVDALSWVMGEQGAKSLRGGKMEDVIFAGTAARAPLGRAEVALTIDNTDGALPIDYTEVTISRTMFRNGGSEYAINGSAARLMDVQDLLSDSGIGREMHVIVGQGQLDGILQATPEGRRGFIEEAAGVLKHRKRKEKALRKLETCDVNLNRLSDLITEIRRQLKPLGRQAEVARRARTVQADLRDARPGCSPTTSSSSPPPSSARWPTRPRCAPAATRSSGTSPSCAPPSPASSRRRSSRPAARPGAGDLVPALQPARTGRRDGVPGRGPPPLLSEQADAPDRSSGRDPEELLAQAQAVREQEEALEEQVEIARERLAEAVDARHEAERAEGEEERRLAGLLRAAADRREGLARLAGQVAARRSRVEAGQEQLARLRAQVGEAEQRAAAATPRVRGAGGQVAGVEAGEQGLDDEHEVAAAALEQAREQVEQARQRERDAEGERATWTARREALELGLKRKDGAAACSGPATGRCVRVRACSGRSPRWCRSDPGTRTPSPPRSGPPPTRSPSATPGRRCTGAPAQGRRRRAGGAARRRCPGGPARALDRARAGRPLGP